MPAAERQGRYRHGIGHKTFRISLGVAAAVYALIAAATTPFSTAADVLTGVPIIVLAVLVVVRWPLHPRPLVLAQERRHPWRAWVVLVAAVVVWELLDYAARGSRADHPTLSSMLDAVDRYYVLKVFMFFFWLWLGAAIIRHGRRGAGAVGPGAGGS